MLRRIRLAIVLLSSTSSLISSHCWSCDNARLLLCLWLWMYPMNIKIWVRQMHQWNQIQTKREMYKNVMCPLSIEPYTHSRATTEWIEIKNRNEKITNSLDTCHFPLFNGIECTDKWYEISYCNSRMVRKNCRNKMWIHVGASFVVNRPRQCSEHTQKSFYSIRLKLPL